MHARPRPHGLLLGGVLASWALVTACERGDALRFPVEFVLARSSAGALPAPVDRDSACIVFLMGGRMVLNSGESYASDFQMSRACREGTEILPSPGTTGRYRLTGDSIVFWNAQGNAAGRGILEGDSLVVRGPTHTLVYFRSTD